MSAKRSKPPEAAESKPLGGLVALTVFVGLPLAAVAWWRHGLLIGGVVLLIPAGMSLAARLRRRQFSRDVFKPKTRMGRVRRSLAVLVVTGIGAWCVAVVTGPGSLSADAGSAAAMAIGSFVFDVCATAGLVRPRGKSKELQMVGQRGPRSPEQRRDDARAIRAARRNGG